MLLLLCWKGFHLTTAGEGRDDPYVKNNYWYDQTIHTFN